MRSRYIYNAHHKREPEDGELSFFIEQWLNNSKCRGRQCWCNTNIAGFLGLTFLAAITTACKHRVPYTHTNENISERTHIDDGTVLSEALKQLTEKY